MIHKLLATTAIVTLVATGGALSQTAPAAPTATTTQIAPQVIHADGHLASAIIGEDVYSGTGDNAQKIGSVGDIVLSPEGEAQALVIGVGGFLGIGKKDVAIEYDLAKWMDRDGSRYLVVQTTREALEALPTFDVAAYRPMPADAQIGNIKPATGEEIRAAAPATPSTVTAADNSTTDKTHTSAIDRSTMVEVPAMELSADNLIGTSVYGANDENVGSIADVILSADGVVDAVTLDVGGFLGIGSKEVAIDLDSLVFMRDSNKLYLYTSLTKAQLEKQPAYDPATFAEHRDEQLIILQR